MKNYWFFGLMAIALLNISCNSTSFAEIQASLPDMSSKSDGVYQGKYDLSGTPVKVTLDVIVQNRNITEINLVQHIRSPIGKKGEKIIENVINQQSLNIDAISGATASSKAILKAIENALQ